MPIELSHLESPLGRIALAVCDSALCALNFTEDEASLKARLERWYPNPTFSKATGASSVAQRIRAYFEGELSALEGIRVDARGTEFQMKVWTALRKIPLGKTASYGGIAGVIRHPKAVRAVGLANGQNPVALVVPCHRVIASDGTLGGYGGGLWRKEWLLRHEGAALRPAGPKLRGTAESSVSNART